MLGPGLSRVSPLLQSRFLSLTQPGGAAEQTKLPSALSRSLRWRRWCRRSCRCLRLSWVLRRLWHDRCLLVSSRRYGLSRGLLIHLLLRRVHRLRRLSVLLWWWGCLRWLLRGLRRHRRLLARPCLLSWLLLRCGLHGLLQHHGSRCGLSSRSAVAACGDTLVHALTTNAVAPAT